jgi:dihydroorotate dehydrogenase (NAD+) catalytic subunit
MADLTTTVGALQLVNPVLAASGTFGFGHEMDPYQDLSRLGGICSKGVTLLPRRGNPPPRVAETASGLLNSVGLQNPGFDHFLAEELPYMRGLGCAVIANIAGFSGEEYVTMGERLDPEPVDVIELNLSCPNVHEGCMSIGSDARQIEKVVRAVRAVTRKPLWAKLTPNVTSIAEMALAAEAGGADAVVLVNTVLGMAIDWRTRRPILRNNTGGLSGPAIKPIALRMVAEAYRSIHIPIIGCGGIAGAADVLEFMIAGARAVQVGTASLVHPTACQDIIIELEALLQQAGESCITDLIGTLQLW